MRLSSLLADTTPGTLMFFISGTLPRPGVEREPGGGSRDSYRRSKQQCCHSSPAGGCISASGKSAAMWAAE